ncbi:hypothetical protein scyTo_0010283 [Scyliorhinus torazame]|uniref:Uncharacterized protein n=1 Tax=Scyliorhinus torazame TaxID=75743 RepID=A0A401P3I1_SCYTO|nr:hypothetical protein [Scyliorhinus torazame]
MGNTSCTVLKLTNVIRICGDYKLGVNQAAKLDKYPIPIAENLDVKLVGGQSYIKLGLGHAYPQLELDDVSRGGDVQQANPLAKSLVMLLHKIKMTLTVTGFSPNCRKGESFVITLGVEAWVIVNALAMMKSYAVSHPRQLNCSTLSSLGNKTTHHSNVTEGAFQEPLKTKTYPVKIKMSPLG